MQEVALVTGGRTGIGRGICEELAKNGYKVIATSRIEEDLGANSIKLVQCDVTTEEGVSILARYLEKTLLTVKVLVNNIGHSMDIVDPFCSIESWNNIFNINLYSAIRMTNLCVPLMKKLAFGRIINIASNAGIENSGPVTFTTSKASLVAYTRSLGRVLASKYPNIVANAILPGVVITPEGHWQDILNHDPERAEKYLRERCPLGRFGEVSEIASLVGFLASSRNSFSHGSIIPIDGGQAKGLMTYSYLN